MVAFLSLGLLIHQFRKDYRAHLGKVSSYVPIHFETVTENKRFVVVIPSFCNEKYVERNLRSVFEQEYDAYRVIYIDDASTDKTVDCVEKMVAKFGMEERVTLVQNKVNKGRTANDYYAIWSCDDDEIVVSLDGDDWFAHSHVLSELNQYYNDPNVWATYGQMITYPKYQRGQSKEPLFHRLQRGVIRAHWHCLRYKEQLFGQPRTFYAGLFKRLKAKDLFYEGAFTKVVGDVAIIWPILEMARGHSVFVPKIAYVYNLENTLGDRVLRASLQDVATEFFFRKKPYPALLEDPREPIPLKKDTIPPIVVFSEDNAMGLYDFLVALQRKVKGKGDVAVFYAATDPASKEAYELIWEGCPDISRRFIDGEIKGNLKKFLEENPSEYVLFTHDRLSIREEVDLDNAVNILESAGATGFYFGSGGERKGGTPISDGGFLWPFSFEKGKGGYNLEMTLYRKGEILPILTALSASSIHEWIEEWQQCRNLLGMGASFKEAKVLCKE